MVLGFAFYDSNDNILPNDSSMLLIGANMALKDNIDFMNIKIVEYLALAHGSNWWGERDLLVTRPWDMAGFTMLSFTSDT